MSDAWARRADQIRSWAEANGFEYSAEFDRNELGVDQYLQALHNWESGENLVTGTHQGVPFRMFDMTESVRSRGAEGPVTTTRRSHTVFLFPVQLEVDGNVQFVRRATLFRMVGLLGLEGIRFSTDPLYADESTRLAEFNELYLVLGDAFGEEPLAQNTPALPCISHELIRRLLETRGWTMDAAPGWLAVVVSGVLLPVEELPACLDEAVELRELIVRGEKSNPPIRMRGSGRPRMTGVFGRMGVLFVGAACGMFATVALFGGMFMLVKKPPAVMVLLFPVVGLPLMVLGAVLAGKLAARWRR